MSIIKETATSDGPYLHSCLEVLAICHFRKISKNSTCQYLGWIFSFYLSIFASKVSSNTNDVHRLLRIFNMFHLKIFMCHYLQLLNFTNTFLLLILLLILQLFCIRNYSYRYPHSCSNSCCC